MHTRKHARAHLCESYDVKSVVAWPSKVERQHTNVYNWCKDRRCISFD